MPSRLAVSARISDDGSQLLDGTISGVIDTLGAMSALNGFYPRVVGYCWGGYWSLAPVLREASDILADGTQDPTRPCDGISIGLGFEASAIQIGPVVTVPPLADPCALDASAE